MLENFWMVNGVGPFVGIGWEIERYYTRESTASSVQYGSLISLRKNNHNLCWVYLFRGIFFKSLKLNRFFDLVLLISR